MRSYILFDGGALALPRLKQVGSHVIIATVGVLITAGSRHAAIMYRRTLIVALLLGATRLDRSGDAVPIPQIHIATASRKP